LFHSPTRPTCPPLFPYTTLFRSRHPAVGRPSVASRVTVVVRVCSPPARATAGAGKANRPSPQTTFATTRPRSQSDTSGAKAVTRSEEHTSELQSPCNLVCRLLLE